MRSAVDSVVHHVDICRATAVMVAELTFAETIVVGAVNVLLTAILIGGFASLLVKDYESRAADRRREADKRHEEGLQARQLEHQTREALRDTYKQLLVAQRRSRETSLELAAAGGTSRNPELYQDARAAHSNFIDLYHQLNLDASRDMWKDARALRDVLDHMLDAGKRGDVERSRQVYTFARSARQNLEDSFRVRLGYEPLHKEKRDVGPFKKE